MKTKNIPAEIIKRIEGLEKKKADELAAIAGQVSENKTKLAAAQKEIKAATERTDLKAYQEAKAKEAEASAAIEMYTSRYAQIERREFVTTKASDEVIDELIKYEDDIAAEFISEISEPLEKIRELYEEYTAGVKAAEGVITAWTHRIHPNYRSAGTIYADGTNVSPVPVPVRRTPFNGCGLSIVVGKFLDKVNGSTEGSSDATQA